MVSPVIFFSFSQKSDFSGFSKFISKCQKEILRYAPPSMHACDFYYSYADGSLFSNYAGDIFCSGFCACLFLL